MISRIMLACALLAYTVPAHAQATAPAATAHLELLPHYDFHMAAQHMTSDDERYVWDANFGGEIDFLGYGRGHATFEANYQAIMGEEIRHFDPNQGNYILAGVVGTRVRGLDVATVFYHQSRHLADRPKVTSVDWNMLGGRVARSGTMGRLSLAGRADIRRVFRRAFVDYTWELDSGLHLQYPVRSGVAVVGSSAARLLGTTGERDRGTQTGVREEAGIRIEGRGAAVEVFASFERRIDPYPLEYGRATWFGVGFRLLSR